MKISSCLVCTLLLVSYTLAIETSQHETTTQKRKGATDKVEPAYGGGGGGWQGGGGGWQGGGGGGGCRHGCCYRGNYGCQRCCSSPEEARAVAEKQGAKGATDKVEKQAKGATDKVEPAYGGGGGGWQGGGGGGGWQGGGGGGGCRHGCCGQGRYGCQRCCSSPEEAKAFAKKEGHRP